MQQPSMDGLVNPGEDLLGGIADLAGHRGVGRGMALLMGALDGATVRAAPDATPTILTRAAWLVQGTASIDGDRVVLHGVVSWDDQGLPRVVAGQIEAARSGGVRVQLLGTAPGVAAAAPAPAPTGGTAREAARRKASQSRASQSKARGTPARAKTTPARAKATPARKAPQRTPADDRIDLSDEVDAIEAKTGPTPAGWGSAVAASKSAQRAAPAAPSEPAPEASPGGWGAAVAASRSERSGGRPSSEGGGWGAAVAASRTSERSSGRSSARSQRGGQPTPDELGFDTPPTLVGGDVLLHPRFGRCVVSRMVGKSKVKLRRPTGALFDLHLKVCSFVREPDEDGKRVFSVTIGRR